MSLSSGAGMVGATEFYRTLSHDAGTGVAGESGRTVTCLRALLGAATGPKEPLQNCVNRQGKMDVDSAPCGQKKKHIHIHIHIFISILVEEGEEGGDKPNHVTLRSVPQDC